MRLADANTKEPLKKIHALYKTAFPKSEKKPFRMILKGRDKGDYEILSIEEEGGEFLGLAITMHYDDLVLLDYFAIEPGCRDSGVGSQALQALQKRYAGKRFLLEIESTRTAAETSEGRLRLRRKAFYMRNGMAPMDFLVNLFGVEMEIMTFDCTVTFEEYHAIFEHLLPLKLADKIKLADRV